MSQGLKPRLFGSANVAAEAATHKAFSPRATGGRPGTCNERLVVHIVVFVGHSFSYATKAAILGLQPPNNFILSDDISIELDDTAWFARIVVF